MSEITPALEEALRTKVREVLAGAKPAESQTPAIVRFNTHGSYHDLEAAVSFLQLAAEAMQGIGNMMQPEYSAADEQMNFARRSDAAAVFRFFGEALKDPAQEAYSVVDTLDLKGFIRADA